MAKKLQVGVISCSHMASRHMASAASNPDTELAMVCDINEEALKKAVAEFKVPKSCTDYREMLADKDIDLVIICTPDQTHKEMTVAALKAGKHVLCEKPMALTMDDCREMIQASREAKTKMMVGQIARYQRSFAEAKKLIERGEIGELFFVESEYAHDYSKIGNGWRLDPLRHGFLGGGCHAVDLLRWIAGDPEEVMAYSNHKVLTDWPTDDATVAIMKFPNNVIGKVFVSIGCKRAYTMRSVFYGSKGTIIADTESPHMTIYQDGYSDAVPLLQGSTSRPHTVPVMYPCKGKDHNTSGELAELVDIILNDKPVKTDAVEGAKTVMVSLAAVESTKTGKPVKLVYDL